MYVCVYNKKNVCGEQHTEWGMGWRDESIYGRKECYINDTQYLYISQNELTIFIRVMGDIFLLHHLCARMWFFIVLFRSIRGKLDKWMRVCALFLFIFLCGLSFYFMWLYSAYCWSIGMVWIEIHPLADAAPAATTQQIASERHSTFCVTFFFILPFIRRKMCIS